ncbi:MAG TPA: YdcF family protein [Bryobacteraceae bacterium]|jgi:uncharacterized SAM-binding protein YcdF (DUF218 family)|nr:YdcF family protein [Bryobacteraceae bacterium]
MEYDAILIPGGGVRAGGNLPVWVTRRLDRAMERAGSAWLVPLSAGTPHRPPPLDDSGFPILEARAGADYLAARGAEPERILIEAASYDTIGNAYFSSVVHAIPRGFRRALVVTSEFHMPRTEAVFRWVYGLAGPGEGCALDFDTVSDEGLDREMLRERIAGERARLAAVGELTGRIRSLADLHRWLFTEHGAYAARRAERREAADPRMY